MNKFLKTILIIVSLILLSIFLAMAIIYYSIVSIPMNFSPLQQFVLTNQYAQLYLFWVAAALAILTIIGIFVIIFYPKRVTRFSLKKNRGELALDKRAIEGYVRTSSKQKDFMNNPKVNVAATKNRIKVKIRGQLKKTSGLIGQTDQWAKNVETKLRELLGSEEKVSIKVKLQAIEPTSSEATVTRPRVE